jgi:hypothetical protein
MAISKKMLMLLLACAPLLFGLGCSNSGKVEQGRVIAFDHQKGLVTIIRDSTGSADKPSYDVLPPITVKIPQDADEMGPAPAAGKRLLFDTQNRKLVVYDAAAGAIKTIAYIPVLELANVAADDHRVKGVKFPVINRESKTITLYSSRDKKLVTFTVADEHLALPEDTWQAGDDVRYYFKQPDQALRMMNVSKTNVMKG